MAKLLALPEVMELLERGLPSTTRSLRAAERTCPCVWSSRRHRKCWGCSSQRARRKKRTTVLRQQTCCWQNGNRPPLHRREVAMKVDLLPVVEACLFGAVSLLSGIVWQQRAKREGGNRSARKPSLEHTAPAALPSNTESVPKAIPNEVTESVPEAIPNEVAARTEVTRAIPTEVTERHAA
jgi:hypothetical protein